MRPGDQVIERLIVRDHRGENHAQGAEAVLTEASEGLPDLCGIPVVDLADQLGGDRENAVRHSVPLGDGRGGHADHGLTSMPAAFASLTQPEVP